MAYSRIVRIFQTFFRRPFLYLLGLVLLLDSTRILSPSQTRPYSLASPFFLYWVFSIRYSSSLLSRIHFYLVFFLIFFFLVPLCFSYLCLCLLYVFLSFRIPVFPYPAVSRGIFFTPELRFSIFLNILFSHFLSLFLCHFFSFLLYLICTFLRHCIP